MQILKIVSELIAIDAFERDREKERQRDREKKKKKSITEQEHKWKLPNEIRTET